MLGSERGVVEEWLSEFKVKALLSSILHHDSYQWNVLRGHPWVHFIFQRKPHTVGVTTVMKGSVESASYCMSPLQHFSPFYSLIKFSESQKELWPLLVLPVSFFHWNLFVRVCKLWTGFAHTGIHSYCSNPLFSALCELAKTVQVLLLPSLLSCTSSQLRVIRVNFTYL